MALNPKTQKRLDGILKHIQDYMDARYAHAARSNPKVSQVYFDIRWQQLTALRLILESTKAYGPDRYYVADILCEENVMRKKSLFNPTDQNSILNEIINLKDKEEKQRRAGQLPIHDMRTFYSALDPSLERIVELIQIWIWWDLADASDMVAFEHQVLVLKQLRDVKLEGAIMEHYQKALKKPASEINRKMVLQFEFDKLESLYKQFDERRQMDAGYQMIVKRDIKEDKTLGEPYDYKDSQFQKIKTIVEQFRAAIQQVA